MKLKSILHLKCLEVGILSVRFTFFCGCLIECLTLTRMSQHIGVYTVYILVSRLGRCFHR